MEYTFVGDSIMNSAEGELRGKFLNANFDTKIGRQFSKLPSILKEMKAKNQLGDTLVVGLGTNGPISDKDFEEVMKIAENRKVIFINTKMPDKWMSAVNNKLNEKARQYPNISIIDYNSHFANKENMFEKDKTHLKASGQKEYADFITNQVNTLNTARTNTQNQQQNIQQNIMQTETPIEVPNSVIDNEVNNGINIKNNAINNKKKTTVKTQKKTVKPKKKIKVPSKSSINQNNNLKKQDKKTKTFVLNLQNSLIETSAWKSEKKIIDIDKVKKTKTVSKDQKIQK